MSFHQPVALSKSFQRTKLPMVPDQSLVPKLSRGTRGDTMK
jgi:hypothetical protein